MGFVVLCAPDLSAAAQELTNSLGSGARILNNPSALPQSSGVRTVILLVSDPSTMPGDWGNFHAPALRVIRGRPHCIVCEEQLATDIQETLSRIGNCLELPVRESGAIHLPDRHSHEGVAFAAAALYEYLLSVTEQGLPIDEPYVDWLLTCVEHAPSGRPESLQRGALEAARTARLLASIRVLAESQQASRVNAPEFKDHVNKAAALEIKLRAAEAARLTLTRALAGAETELRAARSYATGLARQLQERSSSAKTLTGNWLARLRERPAPESAAVRGVPEYFDDRGYRALHADAAEAVARGEFSSGFEHWIRKGLYEGRSWGRSTAGSADEWMEGEFEEDLYLFLNPDVAKAVQNGFCASGREHWIRYGGFEGRAGGELDWVEDRRQFEEKLRGREYGVNVYGFASTISGLGSLVRGSIQALSAQSVPLSVIDIPAWSKTDIERTNADARPWRINLIHQNADMMGRFVRTYGKDLLHGAYNIGYWLWELPSCRMDWWPAYRYVDEVWAASEFCRTAFQTMTPLPVIRMPLVVDDLDRKAIHGRDHFGFAEDVFVFCYIYDIASQLERKNPECLIEAFKREFGASKDVLLFLKSSNMSHDKKQADRLARLADSPNIRIFDGFLTEEEIVSLHKAIDCFVSPHRAEGFGFNMAEAMYFAKPVIATGYSSNLDFMNEGNSYLIDHKLVPIRESAGPYREGYLWADPSVEHLQGLLHRVFHNRAEGEEKGEKAAVEIRANYSAAAIGRMMEERFHALGLDGEKPRSITSVHSTAVSWPRFSPYGVPEAARRQIRSLDYKPLISIVTPVYNVSEEYLRKCIDSVRAQWYPYWELCLCDDASTQVDTLALLEQYKGVDPRIKIIRSDVNGGIAAASNRAAEISTGEFIALLDNDDELSADALYEVALAVNSDRSIEFLYSDEDKIDPDGSYCDHYFKPDWSPEHLMSVMYMLHLLVFRKELFYLAGAFRPEYSGAQDYDLALRLSRLTSKICHIPRILYHWRKIEGSAAAAVDAKPAALGAAERALTDHVRALGLDAEVVPGKFTGSFRVKHRLSEPPRVTLCITTNDGSAEVQGRGRINLVSHFVHSIAEKTDYRNYEILLVDNGNLSDSTRNALRDIPYRVASYKGAQKPFNFAHKANFAFSQVQTNHLVLLNDDLEVITPEWLSALMEFSIQGEIGAVGARLLFPNDTIQHVGIAIGVNGSAGHLYHSYPRDLIGYNGYTHLIRNYSAVTGACMATRMDVISEAGRFDEAFAIDFNDIAFCLSLLERGYRVVYTPFCELYHFEGVTAQRRLQNRSELKQFTTKWAKYMERDPYYNPNLTRNGLDFSAVVTRAVSSAAGF